MNAPFPASRLTCERCSGHGYLKTGLGRLPCLECSAAAAPAWIPASQPPTCEPSPSASRSITVWGVVVTPDGRDDEKVAYWPARGVWTATRMDGNEPADVEVEVSHWTPPLPLPELPCG